MVRLWCVEPGLEFRQMKRHRRLRKLVPDAELIRRRAADEPLRTLASDYNVVHTTLSRFFERPDLARQLRQAQQELRAGQRALARRRSAERRLELEVRRKAKEEVATERAQAGAAAAITEHARRRRPRTDYEAWLDERDGTTTERHAPVEVSGLTNGVAALTVGFYHTCALTSAGAVKCWGDYGFGQLGDGTSSDRHTPVEVISVLPPCIVPNVIGKRLPIAKTAIRKAYCRVGKVIYRRSANARKNRVMAESPTAGKHLKNGAKVKLIVGRGPRRI